MDQGEATVDASTREAWLGRQLKEDKPIGHPVLRRVYGAP